jgi:hypothetical protein
MRKDSLRSIRSSSRARTSERGIALAIAVVVALLYFSLIQLLMFDASQQLLQARRFRARIVALTLAENGAELAAKGLANPVLPASYHDDHEDPLQGIASGSRAKGPVDPATNTAPFVIKGQGEATGVVKMKATVEVTGEVQGTSVKILYTSHSQ